MELAEALKIHRDGPNLEACRSVLDTEAEALEFHADETVRRDLECRLQSLTQSRRSRGA